MTQALHTCDATQLKELLDAGEVSSEEIVRALHTRADEVEPQVGAFAHQFRKESLQQAQRCDEERQSQSHRGLLHGLPISIKESLDTVGLASTLGMRSRVGMIAQKDAVVVQVAQREGAFMIGKTNIPQTLLAPLETTNELFGTTSNPWNLSHGSGGSSGGEGAAVAAGLSPMVVGTDIGGSIRSPAALCGVCGIKPTNDRWSNLGAASAINGQEFIRTQTGPLARSVRDLVLFMRALDATKQAPFDARVPPLAMEDPTEIDATTLRVGYYEDDGLFTPAASVRRAVRESVRLLEKAGVEVIRFSPPNVEEIAYGYFRGISSDGSETLSRALGDEPYIQPLRTLGRLVRMPRQARIGLAKALRLMGEVRVPTMLESLGEKRVHELWSLTAERNRHRLEEDAAWQRAGVDVLLTPALVTPATPHGESHDFTFSFVNLARYNYLNRPAGVVPITRVRPDEVNRTGVRDRLDKRAASVEAKSVGLPVGVQLVGRPWQEAPLLSMMALLESQAKKDGFYPETPVTPHA